MFLDKGKKMLGLRIRGLREARRQTQHELAASANVSLKHLGELERGRGNPSLSSLQRLAEALELPLIELLDTEMEEKSDDMLREEITRRLQTVKPEILRVIHKALRS
jgi:transcriptional regulator with XRE-family HTH domain